MSLERTEKRASEKPGGDRVSMLDEALWSRFEKSRGLSESGRVWLALQIRQIAGVDGGAVVIAETSEGFVPIARWPADDDPQPDLADAIQTALDQEAPAVSAGTAIAVPLVIDEEIVGAAGLHFSTPPSQPTETLRQLRWGMGWLAEAVREVLMGNSVEEGKRKSAVLDLMGAVLDTQSFNGACLAAVNLLVRETGAIQVGLGLMHRGRLRLEALSDVADFRLNTGRTRAIERAMIEATDQEGSVLHPARADQGFMVDRAHAELRLESNLGELLTVPMFSEDGVIGALHLQKAEGEPFSVSEVMIAEGAAAVMGPILTEKRLVDRIAWTVFLDAFKAHLRRLFGPRFIGRKIAAVIVVLLIAFFSVVDGDFRVKAEAEVQGRVIRSVTAPFDGNIAAQFARAGDRVRAGDVLATLDERDLRIELLRARTDIGRFEGEYDRALAERNAPEARIAAANLEESKARAELVLAQLARAEMRAPFDAIVTSGDLSQALGGAVRRGEELFQIAPLEKYRIRVEVEETDLDEIEVGQSGILVLASLPGEEFRVRVTRITPRLEAREGLNVALVEAEISGNAPQIRPGMRGIAKVEIEERLLIDIWSRPIIDWARLAFWRWTP